MFRKHLKIQNGSATIMALIVVSIVAICVTSLVWQQNFAIRKLNIYKENTQMKWLHHSLIDIIRFVLKVDLQNNPNIDHLGEIWALPIENNKVQDYLNASDLPEELRGVEFTASIKDAQGMFNLANLWDTTMTLPNLAGIQTYANVLQGVGIDRNLAEETASAVMNNINKPQSLQDLSTLPGYSPTIINQLKSFVILLPEPTSVNVNTASIEVLMAVFPSFSYDEALTFTQLRANTPIKTLEDLNQMFSKVHPNQNLSFSGQVDFKSSYWLANTSIKMNTNNYNTQTLIKRSNLPQADGNLTSVLWTKQQVATLK
jgi:general secretion pathway protein K